MSQVTVSLMGKDSGRVRQGCSGNGDGSAGCGCGELWLCLFACSQGDATLKLLVAISEKYLSVDLNLSSMVY
jgi:hypothetical protein